MTETIIELVTCETCHRMFVRNWGHLFTRVRCIHYYNDTHNVSKKPEYMIYKTWEEKMKYDP